MTKLKCPKCGHEWEYKGTSFYYVTCPTCKFSLKRNKEEKENERTIKTTGRVKNSKERIRRAENTNVYQGSNRIN